MLYVYLFAAIVGGVLLAASVVAGGHHDHQLGSGGHGDAGHALGDGGHGHGHHASGSSVAWLLFSVRLWTYLLAFGGMTGLLLRWLVGTGEPLAALLSAGVGVGSGALAQTVIRRMGSGELAGTIQDSQIVGKIGQLLLPVGKGSSGKVRVTVQNQAVDLIATSEDELPAREDVLVVEVKEGAAVVTRSPLTQKN